jgi:hypothetical protein
LASAVDQLATRTNPKRLADDAKQSLLAKAQTPAGKGGHRGPAGLPAHPARGMAATTSRVSVPPLCFRGRMTIAAQRGGHPAERHFTVLRISGDGNLWVSECITTYDGVPTYSVSIMEFAHELVMHETQYFADTFSAPTWRAALAEPMPGRHIERA